MKHMGNIATTIIAAVSIALTIQGCHNNPVSSDSSAAPKFVYRDPYAWPVATPASQGLDTTKISVALQEMKSNVLLYSFLVVRNDSLVFEYSRGFQKENDFEIHSAAKSFMSALVGIAIDRGIIRSVQERILGYFPDFDTAGIDPRKRAWTIEHFLRPNRGRSSS